MFIFSFGRFLVHVFVISCVLFVFSCHVLVLNQLNGAINRLFVIMLCYIALTHRLVQVKNAKEGMTY